MIIIVGILICTKLMRNKKPMVASNQNEATYRTSSTTTSSNLQNAPSAPAFSNLNYLPRSTSINTHNKTNNPMNSEDKPPTYEEFLQSNK